MREPSRCTLPRSVWMSARTCFRVHGIDAAEKVVVRKQLRRSQVMAFFEALAPCPVGMEACAARITGRVSSRSSARCVCKPSNQPGGNLTGMTLISSTLIAKRMEILTQLIPEDPLDCTFDEPGQCHCRLRPERCRGSGPRAWKADRHCKCEKPTRLQRRVRSDGGAARWCGTRRERSDFGERTRYDRGIIRASRDSARSFCKRVCCGRRFG